jgi:hypothetical protein
MDLECLEARQEVARHAAAPQQSRGVEVCGVSGRFAWRNSAPRPSPRRRVVCVTASWAIKAREARCGAATIGEERTVGVSE